MISHSLSGDSHLT